MKDLGDDKVISIPGFQYKVLTTAGRLVPKGLVRRLTNMSDVAAGGRSPEAEAGRSPEAEAGRSPEAEAEHKAVVGRLSTHERS